MDKIKKEKKLCMACMEEHEIYVIVVKETNIFKDIEVEYNATYYYCDKSDEYFSDEDMITSNDISMKDAYRKKVGLLTSTEIIDIRRKYGISQADLALILGWGGKTITRYESHQVQDNAHDTVLRKINEDPEWYLKLLKNSKDFLSKKTYEKYLNIAIDFYSNNKDLYLEKSILSQYARYSLDYECGGNCELNLRKVTDVIRYFANSDKVKSLFTVKLMKMLWYADALSYKRYNHSITGLVYKALPMGAVPVSYETIIDLSGVVYEEVEINDNLGYHFISSKDKNYLSLTEKDIVVLDKIIDEFKDMSKKEIIKCMHNEVAYSKTELFEIINYKYALDLSID